MRLAGVMDQRREGRHSVEHREHDVLRLRVRDEAEAHPVEGHAELDDGRLRIEELRELELEIRMVAVHEREEVRRHEDLVMQ